MSSDLEFIRSLEEITMKDAKVGDYCKGSPECYPFLIILAKIVTKAPQHIVVENTAVKNGVWKFPINHPLKLIHNFYRVKTVGDEVE